MSAVKWRPSCRGLKALIISTRFQSRFFLWAGFCITRQDGFLYPRTKANYTIMFSEISNLTSSITEANDHLPSQIISWKTIWNSRSFNKAHNMKKQRTLSRVILLRSKAETCYCYFYLVNALSPAGYGFDFKCVNFVMCFYGSMMPLPLGECWW